MLCKIKLFSLCGKSRYTEKLEIIKGFHATVFFPYDVHDKENRYEGNFLLKSNNVHLNLKHKLIFMNRF